jgi:beta-glucosidase
VIKLRAYLSFSLIGLLLSGTASAQSPASHNDQDRADALLKQMTTEEKIGQLNQPFYAKLPIPGAKTDPVSFEDHVRRGEWVPFCSSPTRKKLIACRRSR